MLPGAGRGRGLEAALPLQSDINSRSVGGGGEQYTHRKRGGSSQRGVRGWELSSWACLSVSLVWEGAGELPWLARDVWSRVPGQVLLPLPGVLPPVPPQDQTAWAHKPAGGSDHEQGPQDSPTDPCWSQLPVPVFPPGALEGWGGAAEPRSFIASLREQSLLAWAPDSPENTL